MTLGYVMGCGAAQRETIREHGIQADLVVQFLIILE